MSSAWTSTDPDTVSADQNHNDEIITIVAVFSNLSFITLILRVLSRRLKSIALHVDDYLLIASWVGGCQFAALESG